MLCRQKIIHYTLNASMCHKTINLDLNMVKIGSLITLVLGSQLDTILISLWRLMLMLVFRVFSGHSHTNGLHIGILLDIVKEREPKTTSKVSINCVSSLC